MSGEEKEESKMRKRVLFPLKRCMLLALCLAIAVAALPVTATADSGDSWVIYWYRSKSGGLSCYHSFNGDLEDFQLYAQVGASEAFKYLYGYALSGELTGEAKEYIQELGYPDIGV